MYGPGDEEMKAIFDAMRRGVAPVPGDPAARNSLIHVTDLVAAMRAAGHHPALADVVEAYEASKDAAAAEALAKQRGIWPDCPPEAGGGGGGFGFGGFSKPAATSGFGGINKSPPSGFGSGGGDGFGQQPGGFGSFGANKGSTP